MRDARYDVAVSRHRDAQGTKDSLGHQKVIPQQLRPKKENHSFDSDQSIDHRPKSQRHSNAVGHRPAAGGIGIDGYT
jgi:hypothetical protein